jgi:hypothetical protein
MHKFGTIALAAALAVGLTSPAGASLLVPPGPSDTVVVFGDSDDDFSGPVALPFNFSFFGQSYNEVYVGTNGNLTFEFGDSNSFNAPLPEFGPPRIAPFFDDLTLASGDVRTNSSTNQFVVTWNGLATFDGVLNAVTAQAILRSDGSILFSYGDLLASDGEVTVGISDGLNAAATLGAFVGNPDGTLADADLSGLANRTFAFIPDGNGGYAAIPEPSSMAGVALLGLGGYLYRRRRARA